MIDKAIQFLDSQNLLNDLEITILPEEGASCYQPSYNRIIIREDADFDSPSMTAFCQVFEQEIQQLDMVTVIFAHELGHYYHHLTNPIEFLSLIESHADTSTALVDTALLYKEQHSSLTLSLLNKLVAVAYRNLPIELIADRNAKLICQYLIENKEGWN